VVVARVGVRVPLGPGSVVPKLEEPEPTRLAHDLAADLLADLAGECREHGLRFLPPAAWQHVQALIVEHEHLAVLAYEHRAGGNDELERRLFLSKETRKDERGHTPNDISGRDRDQLVNLAQ